MRRQSRSLYEKETTWFSGITRFENTGERGERKKTGKIKDFQVDGISLNTPWSRFAISLVCQRVLVCQRFIKVGWEILEEKISREFTGEKFPVLPWNYNIPRNSPKSKFDLIRNSIHSVEMAREDQEGLHFIVG